MTFSQCLIIIVNMNWIIFNQAECHSQEKCQRKDSFKRPTIPQSWMTRKFIGPNVLKKVFRTNLQIKINKAFNRSKTIWWYRTTQWTLINSLSVQKTSSYNFSNNCYSNKRYNTAKWPNKSNRTSSRDKIIFRIIPITM